MSPPRLIDRKAAERALARAHARGFADFLLRHAAADLAERLATVKRDFVTAVDIGTPNAAFVEEIVPRAGVGQVVRLAPPGAPARSSTRVSTVVSGLEALPLATARFDLAVSGLALHLTDDLPGTLIQIRRALKPDGLFLACLAGGDTLVELRRCFAQAESELLGGLNPHILPFADLRDLGGLLQRAGFALPVTDTETLTVRYADAFALMRDLRGMGAVNVLVERGRVPMPRAVLMRCAELYQQSYSDADGRIRATFEWVWLSGWAPHESQQKPLRPGSARTSLTEVLKPSRPR